MKINRFRPLLVSLPLLFTLLSPLCVSAQCRDPWINQAYRELGRTPVGQGEAGVCNIKLYNNGTWGAYPELKGYVQQFLASGIKVGYAMVDGGNSVMAVRTTDGVVAISGLNPSGFIVWQSTGNHPNTLVVNKLLSEGGASLISQDGGGFQGTINANTPGFSFGNGYTLQSGERKRVKTSGNGAIVIR